MPYYNIRTTVKPIEDRFERLVLNSNKTVTSRLKKNMGYGGLAVTIFMGRAADSLIGTLSGLGSLAILHSNRSLRKFTKRHIKNSEKMLSIPYAKLMKIVSNVDLTTNETSFLLKHLIVPLIDKLMLPLRESTHWIVRNVAFRIVTLITIIFANIVAGIELSVGVIAASLSLLILGRSKSLNHIAYTQLQALIILPLNYHLSRLLTKSL